MASAPAFQLYAGDWLASTRGVSAAARGAYIDLLCCAWLEDGLPNDSEAIRRKAAVERDEWPAIWNELCGKWPLSDDGKRRNPRQEAVRQEQAMYRRRASDGGKARAIVLNRCLPPAKQAAKPPAKRVLNGCTSSSPSSSEESKDLDSSVPKTSDAFSEFWRVYPRKVGRAAALKAWMRLKPSRSLVERIVSAVEAQSLQTQWTRDNGQYVPFPATWLNRGQWEDEIASERQGSRGSSVKDASEWQEWVCPHTPTCNGKWYCLRKQDAEQVSA